jgi:hypothetical protein
VKARAEESDNGMSRNFLFHIYFDHDENLCIVILSRKAGCWQMTYWLLSMAMPDSPNMSSQLIFSLMISIHLTMLFDVQECSLR